MHLARDAFEIAPLRNFDPDAAYKRECCVDLASRALYEYGAGRVKQSEFRMPNGNGAKCFLLVNANYVDYNLGDRRVRRHPNIHGQCGVRLGPTASCALPQSLKQPRPMPPALRKATPREVLPFLRARAQIGYPASMRTGASLGYSAMG